MKVILRNARNQDFFVSRKNTFKINSYMPFFGTVFFSKLFFEDGKKARFWNFYKCRFAPLASERLGGGASEHIRYEGDKFEIDAAPKYI